MLDHPSASPGSSSNSSRLGNIQDAAQQGQQSYSGIVERCNSRFSAHKNDPFTVQ